LNLQESPVAVQHQVISLIHAERKKDTMTLAYKARQNRGLGSLTDIDGMIGENGFRQHRTHVRNVDKTSDGIAMHCSGQRICHP
jgi:hypothetical protein